MQDTFAQLEVAVEQRNVLTYRLDQIVIYTDRDIVTSEGVLPARTIVVLGRVKDVRLHLRCQRRCNGIALLQERAMQSLEGIFAHPAIRTANEELVIPFSQFYLFARLIFDGRKL